MKRPMISAIEAVAVLATAITLLWSHPSTKLSAGTVSMPSLQEHLSASLREHLYTAANAK
jgi:hypothetical protein